MLLAADGPTAEGIATAVGKSLLTVRRWRRRYVAKGVDGLLKDATRPSRVKPLNPEKIKQVVHMTLHEKPPKAKVTRSNRVGCASRNPYIWGLSSKSWLALMVQKSRLSRLCHS